jgi:hypothetical protein
MWFLFDVEREDIAQSRLLPMADWFAARYYTPHCLSSSSRTYS